MFQPKNFDYLLGVQGFSDTMLKNHFALYQGYVINTNKIIETLENFLKDGKTSSPEYAELKRHFGWEWNGMRLHELYFENMTKEKTELKKESDFYKTLVGQFGSYDNWLKDFKATGTMRGIGWTILYRDNETKKLFNVWINEHDIGHFVNSTALLILDVFEHAYVLDYGLKRADYIETFFNALNWDIVAKRFQ